MEPKLLLCFHVGLMIVPWANE